MIRTLWVALNATLATIILGALVIGTAPLRMPGRLYGAASRLWARWVVWASGVRVHVRGLENIDPARPQVIVANHQSWYDVFALSSVIPKRFRFVAKKELGYIPIFGIGWKVAGHISIDRSDRVAAVASLEHAGQLVRSDGSAIVIFPEGTRSATGELQPFKKGAFMLAIHNQLDIVPVAVRGSRWVLPKGSWRVRAGPIIVRFDSPVSTAGYHEGNRDALVQEVRARIQGMLDAEEPLLTPRAS